MRDDINLKTCESVDRAQQREKTLIRRMCVSRWNVSLLGISLLFILLLLTLFHHIASKPGLSKRSEKPQALELATLDQGRDTANINPEMAAAVFKTSKPSSTYPVGVTVMDVYSHPTPTPKGPIARTVFDVYVAPERRTKTSAAFAEQVEAPALDLALVPSPDRYVPGEGLPDLRPPSIEASHTAVLAASSGATYDDARAVMETLQQYCDAWNARHVDQITALRPRLTRRIVDQELSGARSIVMRIQPTSAPRIAGNRATVQCIHKVDQVFTDGVEKQNPGVNMTYVLMRRGSNWLIEDSR